MSHTAMSKPQQLQAIKQAYSDLLALNLQDGFRDVPRFMFDKNLAAERQHRKFRPDHMRCGITANDAAKLFTVQHLLEGFAEPDKYAVDAILSIRSEVLYAQAYAKRFHKELEAWAAKYAEPIKAIDYAKMMEVSQ